MDQNQAVNRGGGSDFFQAWKNKEKKLCCENKGAKNYILDSPEVFGKTITSACIMEHVTPFRPLIVVLHMNERLRAIYCISKSHIRH